MLIFKKKNNSTKLVSHNFENHRPRRGITQRISLERCLSVWKPQSGEKGFEEHRPSTIPRRGFVLRILHGRHGMGKNVVDRVRARASKAFSRRGTGHKFIRDSFETRAFRKSQC